MEENKNKVMIAIILGVVIVFATVGIYLVLNKISTDEKAEKNSSSNVENEQLVNLDVSSELVTKLISYVDIHTTKFYENEKVTVNNLSMAEQYEMAFKEIDSKGITLGCDLEAMKKVVQNDDVTLEDCFFFDYEIPEKNLEKAMKKVLGENVSPDKTSTPLKFNFSTKWKYKDLSLQKGLSSFQEESFESFIGSDIYYDATKKVYVGNYETQGGGWTDNGIISKVESASKEGKKVTLVTKVIFIDLYPSIPTVVGAELEEYSIYSDLKFKNQIGSIKVENYDAFTSDKEFESILEQYKDKAATIVYTFEENSDGSYHFVSSEKK